MIRNTRQASVSRKTREELLHAAEQASADRRSSYLALAEEIQRDLEEYESIQSGQLTSFEVEGVDSLGESLIKARLARGWTQRELAVALQVSEQMVQRDETRLYEHAGLSRLAEIADVLGYHLSGAFRPTEQLKQMSVAIQPSVTMNVNVRVFVTGPAWSMAASVKSQSLTSGVPFALPAGGYGNTIEPLARMLGGNVTSEFAPLNFVNPDRSTDAFDSAATVPLEVTGDKSL